MGIAIWPGVSAPHLAIDAANETLDRSRAVDLLVLDQVRTKAWDRLLFVECGDGWLAEEAWRRMGKGSVCGLSTSAQLVDLAARLRGVPGRVEFKPWGGDRFPLSDRSFDRVIVCVPWSSLLDPRAVLREVARTLRPEGDAYILESDGSTPTTSHAAQAADLGPLLADAGLGEVRRTFCASAPSERRDRAPLGVVHVRLRGPGA
jgi:ubiquinone/menaquinone biosynthesis C-methylase UbiE